MDKRLTWLPRREHLEEVSAGFFLTEFKVGLLERRVGDLVREAGVALQSICEWREAYRVNGAGGLNRMRGRKVGWRERASPPPAASDPSSSDASRPRCTIVAESPRS